MVKDEADTAGLGGFDGFESEWISGYDAGTVAGGREQLTVPESDYFSWLTGDGKVVKSLTDGFVTDAIDPQLVRSSAYWHAK